MADHGFDLSGKVALVTGGASGIGKAIAGALIQAGARAVVGSRTLDKVKGAVEELNALRPTGSTGRSCEGVALDVTQDASIEAAIDQTIAVFGRLDILVNSAGIMLKKPILELQRGEFNAIYDTNVTGSLMAAKIAAQKAFLAQKSGCIINIASITTFVDLVGVTGYAASKNGVQGITRALANEWAKHGIRCNAIAPGFIPTDINRKMIEGTDRGRRIIEHTPMGRFGLAEEVAGAAVYLASPAAGFVTGVILPVDGGYLCSGISDAVAPWAK